MIQHGQQVEGFWVPFSVIIGADLVAFQELGDEGEIAQDFELVAGIAYELLEGGVTRFFYNRTVPPKKNIFRVNG